MTKSNFNSTLTYTLATLHSGVQKLAKVLSYDVVGFFLSPKLFSQWFRQEAQTFTYYALFTQSICWAGSFSSNLLANQALTFFAGALMQGNPACGAQQKIEKFPKTAFLVGGVNGLLCAGFHYGFTWLSSFVVTSYKEEMGVHILLTTTVMPLLCREVVMCPLEEKIADMLGVPKSCCSAKLATDAEFYR